MIKLTEIALPETVADDVLTIPFDLRQKSRFSAKTDNGREVALFLTRGKKLLSDMVLTGSDGIKVIIKAASEPVSVMYCDDTLQFAKACYHLGNRHVPLQILAGELRFISDHVLDQMLDNLGLTVDHEVLPFEPVAGAYHKHGH